MLQAEIEDLLKLIETMNHEEKERLNHQAYDDVLERKGPSQPNNKYYMYCYHSWNSLNPDEYDDYYGEL